MVNHEIVRNPQNPRQKLAFIVVRAALQRLDHLNKCVLKNVVGNVTIANYHHDVRIHTFLMAVDKFLETIFVPGNVQVNQFLVVLLVVAHNTLLFGFLQLVLMKT
jgi:hypothetical protein